MIQRGKIVDRPETTVARECWVLFKKYSRAHRRLWRLCFAALILQDMKVGFWEVTWQCLFFIR